MRPSALFFIALCFFGVSAIAQVQINIRDQRLPGPPVRQATQHLQR
jgi:hypothetical protein